MKKEPLPERPKEKYFSVVNEATLISNYENGGYRHHYFAIKDSEQNHDRSSERNILAANRHI